MHEDLMGIFDWLYIAYIVEHMTAVTNVYLLTPTCSTCLCTQIQKSTVK